MDNLQDRVLGIIERAEREMRELGADAFRTGDDTSAGRARDAVAAFKSLRVHLNGKETYMPTPAPPLTSSRAANVRAVKDGQRILKKYPKYEVRLGTLVRIGWSKKGKAEYEHKASREAFDRTIAAMMRIMQTGTGPFAADKIIEFASGPDVIVPSYQVYVVIGVLRDHQCVTQIGRNGYMIPADLPSRASALWDQLRRGK